LKNNIILIGYMGCGKSTLGKKLSFRERIALLDTDKMIEQRKKKTVSEIFASDGEESFRRMETECLKEILRYTERYVIAVGGGLPLKEQNQRLLKKLGTVLYLRAEADTIYGRLKNDTTRPLLQGENPQEKIKVMLENRGPVYEAVADAVIDVDGKSYEVIIEEILNIVRGKEE
jgi:shikimate kinase